MSKIIEKQIAEYRQYYDIC